MLSSQQSNVAKKLFNCRKTVWTFTLLQQSTVKITEIDGILPTIKYEILCEPVTSYNTARISMLNLSIKTLTAKISSCDSTVFRYNHWWNYIAESNTKYYIEPEIPSRNDCRNNGQ